MPELRNVPLFEVVFEMKWGKTKQEGNEILIEFSQKEQTLMPGKLQLFAADKGYNLLEITNRQIAIPHIVKYRYRKGRNGYPILQLGNGVFTVNQIDFGDFEYKWETFLGDIEQGIKLFEKSYIADIKELPLIDIQLRYTDVILAEKNEPILSFINNKLNIGTLQLPKQLLGNENIVTDSQSGSIALQVGCKKPEGQIIFKINQGKKDGEKAFILDFIIFSSATIFANITQETIVTWCIDAHKHLSDIFHA